MNFLIGMFQPLGLVLFVRWTTWENGRSRYFLQNGPFFGVGTGTKQFFVRMEALTGTGFSYIFCWQFLLKKTQSNRKSPTKFWRNKSFIFMFFLWQIRRLNCCCCCCCGGGGGGGGGAVCFKDVESSALVSNFTLSSYGKLGGVSYH